MENNTIQSTEAKEYTYMTSLLTFYMKGKITVTGRSVKLTIPNTFLKFIPLGSRTYEPMISQISSVNNSFKLNAKPLFFGIIVVLGGISAISDSFLTGLILLLIGIGEIISAFETVMYITENSGRNIGVSALIFDKKTIEDARNEIQKYLLMRVDDTNSRMQTNRIVNAINNQNEE